MKRSCLLFISGACLSLASFAPAFATNPDTTQFSVEVKPYLNVTLSDADVHLPITPSSTGTFGSANLTASASTNSALGYALTVSYLDSSDNLNTDLVSNTLDVNNGTYPTIPTFAVSDELTSEAFSASTSEDHLNHWAISIDDAAHYKKAVQGATIATSNGPIADDTTTINLATKLDLRTTPGSYSVIMNFQVVANVAPTVSLDDAFGDNNKTPVTIGGEDYYKIQDMTPGICSSVTEPNSTLRVVDVRDNSIYTIGKLADGKCWLLDNLALDLTASGASTNITSANTNADTTSLNALFGVSNRDVSTDPDGNLATSGVVGGTYNSGWSYPSINVAKKDEIPSDTISTNGGYKIGVYYNFCAASAGSYCFGSGDDLIDYENEGNQLMNKPDTAIDAEYDICPAGWRLPTGDSGLGHVPSSDDREYQKLYDEYNDYTTFRTALRLPLSGNYIWAPYYGGEIGEYGEYQEIGLMGYTWSSTWYSGSMYLLTVTSSNFSDYLWDTDRLMGFPVRCIAKY